VACAPQNTTLADFVWVAWIRWVVESCFEAIMGEVGLEHYEGRSWTGWDRQSTLTMTARPLSRLRNPAGSANGAPRGPWRSPAGQRLINRYKQFHRITTHHEA
jgi:SRSO17 transposase